MSIFLRIWGAFAIVLLMGAYITVSSLQQQVKPSVKKAIEDTLADNANLLSVLLVDDIKQQRLTQPEFNQKIKTVLARQLQAHIWDYQKSTISQQLYITDDKGIVLFDSRGVAVGQDYSQWNDVYLTLQGRYGVRTTRSNAQDENSSVMYVAAPIRDGQRIIGVVTLSKEGKVMQPFIQKAQQDMVKRGVIVAVIALLLSALVAWWLRHAIYLVAQYALTLAPQQRQPLRFWAAKELNQLVAAINKMRQELEGKRYIENYVHTLTHELKSPLTAIKASAELLQDELPSMQRMQFSTNITQQTDKLQLLIERLLLLARLEQQQHLQTQAIDLSILVNKVIEQKQPQIQQRQIHLLSDLAHSVMVMGEAFWLEQAISNVLDNAIEFTPQGKSITVKLSQNQQQVTLIIENQGQAIPDYALPRVFERYYSLPRPDSQHKSTGLGLTLVQEVMALHQGQVSIHNNDDGVSVALVFVHR
ncbi:MAG: two-component system sensor histidine kinase CreC [Moraxellaceae bacterium]|nr:two-component system sensor histidine kinase CreC [Moraxellaceae bacterium]